MKQASKIVVAILFAIAPALILNTTATQLSAQQVSEACGCGVAKCGGCLKGKLFPVKNLAASVKAKKPCACAECQGTPSVISESAVTHDVLISTEYLPAIEVAAPAPACGCGVKNCGCRLKRARRGAKVACPECDSDFCQLKVSKGKEEKKCFEVTQKEVCIPAVRLPWKKCCPLPKSKVRVVNVLKTKKYECPKCNYEWKVYEPEVPKAESSESSKSGLFGSSDSKDSDESAQVEEVDPVAPSAPKITVPEPPKASDLKLDSVPRPPVETEGA